MSTRIPTPHSHDLAQGPNPTDADFIRAHKAADRLADTYAEMTFTAYKVGYEVALDAVLVQMASYVAGDHNVDCYCYACRLYGVVLGIPQELDSVPLRVVPGIPQELEEIPETPPANPLPTCHFCGKSFLEDEPVYIGFLGDKKCEQCFDDHLR